MDRDKAYQEILNAGVEALVQGTLEAQKLIQQGNYKSAAGLLNPLMGGVIQQHYLCQWAAESLTRRDNAEKEKDKRV